MIDHITVHVSDITRSRAFYEVALAPLGYEVIMAFPQAVGMGVAPKPDLWLAEGPVQPFHIAIRASSRAVVHAFYEAAIAAGGEDNGVPGPRPQYHPGYYGAFVLDPDGNNLEAVIHTPE